MAEDRMLSDEILLGLINKNSGGGGGTTNYNNLENLPQIGGVTLQGNKTASDLGLATETALADKADKSAVKNEFLGTLDEWNALTVEQRKAYDTYQITDDYAEDGGGGSDEIKFKSQKYVGTGTTSHIIDFDGETPKQILSITIDPDDYEKSGLQYLTKTESIMWGSGFASVYFFSNDGHGHPSSLSGSGTYRALKLEYSGNVLTVTASDAENAMNQNGISYIVNYLV